MQLKAFLGLFYRWPYCFTSSPPVGTGKIQLKQSPLQQYHQEGTNISLSCSADSSPLAPFYWFLNGDLLPDTGPQLRLTDIQMNQRGNSSCQAFNNRKMRNETSRPVVTSALSLAKQSQNTWPTLYLHLKPTGPVSNATVTSNSTHLIDCVLDCPVPHFAPPSLLSGRTVALRLKKATEFTSLMEAPLSP